MKARRRELRGYSDPTARLKTLLTGNEEAQSPHRASELWTSSIEAAREAEEEGRGGIGTRAAEEVKRMRLSNKWHLLVILHRFPMLRYERRRGRRSEITSLSLRLQKFKRAFRIKEASRRRLTSGDDTESEAQ